MGATSNAFSFSNAAKKSGQVSGGFSGSSPALAKSFLYKPKLYRSDRRASPTVYRSRTSLYEIAAVYFPTKILGHYRLAAPRYPSIRLLRLVCLPRRIERQDHCPTLLRCEKLCKGCRFLAIRSSRGCRFFLRSFLQLAP